MQSMQGLGGAPHTWGAPDPAEHHAHVLVRDPTTPPHPSTEESSGESGSQQPAENVVGTDKGQGDLTSESCTNTSATPLNMCGWSLRRRKMRKRGEGHV